MLAAPKREQASLAAYSEQVRRCQACMWALVHIWLWLPGGRGYFIDSLWAHLCTDDLQVPTAAPEEDPGVAG